MLTLRNAGLALVTFSAVGLQATIASAASINLNNWTAESASGISDFPDRNWIVSSPLGESVTQTVNGQPTFFYSDFDAFNAKVSGKIRVSDTDNDFIGFALGFNPGDTTNTTADYLLVDWRRGDQFYNFGFPSNTPGSTAKNGLAVSRIIGFPTADEFWGHVDFASHAGGSVTELARGNTLDNTGWENDREYTFDFIFTDSNLQVFVDGALELDINGSFNNGRMAFYNFSQRNVTYSAFEVEPAGRKATPEPASLIGLLGLGALGLARGQRKRQQGQEA